MKQLDALSKNETRRIALKAKAAENEGVQVLEDVPDRQSVWGSVLCGPSASAVKKQARSDRSSQAASPSPSPNNRRVSVGSPRTTPQVVSTFQGDGLSGAAGDIDLDYISWGGPQRVQLAGVILLEGHGWGRRYY